MSIEIHNKEPKTFVVLGASHTATSVVAKGLNENGINMHISDHENFRLYYEDPMFLALNERILEAAGGAALGVPTDKAIMDTDFEDEIKIAINTRRGKMWGWKDPRNALTLRKYLPHLEGDVYIVCCFRRPGRVVDSWKKKYPKSNYNRAYLNKVNRRIIKGIKEFCEL